MQCMDPLTREHQEEDAIPESQESQRGPETQRPGTRTRCPVRGQRLADILRPLCRGPEFLLLLSLSPPEPTLPRTASWPCCRPGLMLPARPCAPFPRTDGRRDGPHGPPFPPGCFGTTCGLAIGLDISFLSAVVWGGQLCGSCGHRKRSGVVTSTGLQLECVSTTGYPPTSHTHPPLPVSSVCHRPWAQREPWAGPRREGRHQAGSCGGPSPRVGVEVLRGEVRKAEASFREKTRGLGATESQG